MTSYRLDIDGLRAIAVLIVIGFHLKLSFLSGGHIGVDVFFVLSGYLITSNLVRQMIRGTFSIKEFYSKRIQRLFPALFTTVVLTFIAAAFILLPEDFDRFSKSVVATIFSLSNFIFWSESGYWDVSSETKALLHTWSLGVEEQFYLVWPAVLLLIVKSGIKVTKALFALTVLGFVFCYFHSLNDISGAFYLLPSRVFQFSSGGLLAALLFSNSFKSLLQVKRLRDTLLVLGLSLLAFGSVMFSEDVRYPGAYALVPTFGAFFILMAGSNDTGQGWIGRGILENSLLVWIGQVSYSLYLVHWPIIVLYRLLTGAVLTTQGVCFLVVAIFAAASLLHYGVERRFYSRRFTAGQEMAPLNVISQPVLLTLGSGLVIAAVATHAWSNGGWTWRFPELLYSNEAIKAAMTKRVAHHSAACQILEWPADGKCSPKESPTVLFFGNSHEPDGFNFMRAAYPEHIREMDVVNFSTINDCKNLAQINLRWQTDSSYCQKRLDRLFEPDFVSDLDVIVYSAHYTFKFWSSAGWEIIKDLKSMNGDIRVITFSDYLETTKSCVNILNKTGATDSCFSEENIAYNPSDSAQSLYPIYRPLVDLYINRMNLLCEDAIPSTCKSETEDGIPYSFDNHHNSLEFSEMSGRMYAKINPGLFDDILEEDFDSSATFGTKGMDDASVSEIETKIQEMYVGFLNRAADRQGLEYWLIPIVEGVLTLEHVRAALTSVDQAEYMGIHSGLNHSQLVTTVYKNILERTPDSVGLNYWVGELASGRVNEHQMVNTIIRETTDPKDNASEFSVDFAVFSNKIKAAEYFTEQTKNFTFDASFREAARAAIMGVTQDVNTLNYSKASTDEHVKKRRAISFDKY
ncbi:MAG: acyltransferase family protein [Porticoccaceae bacterium]|nr:acyltransferase family protein [Porticoccaceae bacterium]